MGHDGSGHGDGWYLDRVTITETEEPQGEDKENKDDEKDKKDEDGGDQKDDEWKVKKEYLFICGRYGNSV